MKDLRTWLFLLPVLLAGCGSQEDIKITKPSPEQAGSEWVLVESKLGRFEALMPGKPIPETNVITLNTVSVTEYGWTTEIGKVIAYSVRFYEMPPSVRDVSVSKLMSGVKEQLASRGKIIDEEQVEYHGRSGRKFVLEILNGQGRCTIEVFFIESRCYFATVVMPNQFFVSPKKPDTTRHAETLMKLFFDSLQFKLEK